MSNENPSNIGTKEDLFLNVNIQFKKIIFPQTFPSISLEKKDLALVITTFICFAV